MSCNKNEVPKNKTNDDAFFIGSWQQTRKLEKDYRNSASPQVTTTHHSLRTPLPKMIFNENRDLIIIYKDSSYSFEDIYYYKWEIRDERFYRDGLIDGSYNKYGADSFVKIVDDYSEYSIQTEWKRIK